MPSIDSYRKQAKLLVRWHRERNYSVGGKVRLIERFCHLTDAEVLDTAFPLTLAQEIVAAEAGWETWEALRNGLAKEIRRAAIAGELTLMGSVPILFVRDVTEAVEFTKRGSAFTSTFCMANRRSMDRSRGIDRTCICGSFGSPISSSLPDAKAR